MVKKKKKTNKKVNLQEPQEIMGDEPQVDDSKPEKKRTEESEIEEGMVHCKSCKNDVEPYPVEHNKWRCPDCNKYTQSPDMSGKNIELLKETKPSKDRPYEIHSSRNIKFSGNELAQAEMLISSGVANNFNDLAKKAFNILFLRYKVKEAFGAGTNKMENQEPNPERTMRQIQEQEMMKAYVESMKKGPQDPMMTMMMMRMMENQSKGKESGDNGFMKELMQMQMMKMFSGGQNSDTSGLQKEIADLKHQTQMQQLMNQQSQVQQGNQSSQEFMQTMERIRAERDQSIKQAEINAQQERDKNLQLTFENRRIDLDSKLQAMEKELKEKGSGQMATQRINQLKEEIGAIKEMSKVLGGKEKGAGEYIGETITNVAHQLQPTITSFMEGKRQQAEMQQQMQQQAAMQVPQEIPEPTNPDMPMESAEMTPSEKDMADTMNDMYIEKK